MTFDVFKRHLMTIIILQGFFFYDLINTRNYLVDKGEDKFYKL